MTNAKAELLQHLTDYKKNLLCASITYSHSYSKENDRHITLKTKHNQDDLQDFFDRLDFEYNEGYGTQYLYGTLWFTDRTWSTRHEYDGKEEWELHQRPPVPAECK